MFQTHSCPQMVRFQPCEPQMFCLGDIVQAQLSFVVVPIKGGHHKMLAVLQSLAMLDGNFGQVWIQSTQRLCAHTVFTIGQRPSKSELHTHGHIDAKAKDQIYRDRCQE